MEFSTIMDSTIMEFDCTSIKKHKSKVFPRMSYISLTWSLFLKTGVYQTLLTEGLSYPGLSQETLFHGH